ncbi:TPA: hypothetical protein NIE30_002844 [Pseudomonas aeruginosa]|uniref:hypothetical protein n=1 Tax=Pseudomonas sp. TaxID=306 RepID=UPI0005F29ACC|nr:hypothetical protein N619_18380 [Pseudomonas oleovorans]HCF4209914.1 hypothetical protein [Pseudomonas aeruginosa]
MYDIHQHKHRYAVWTASRAWNRKLKGGDLALAQRLIGVAGLESVRGPDECLKLCPRLLGKII